MASFSIALSLTRGIKTRVPCQWSPFSLSLSRTPHLKRETTRARRVWDTDRTVTSRNCPLYASQQFCVFPYFFHGIKLIFPLQFAFYLSMSDRKPTQLTHDLRLHCSYTLPGTYRPPDRPFWHVTCSSNFVYLLIISTE